MIKHEWNAIVEVTTKNWMWLLHFLRQILVPTLWWSYDTSCWSHWHFHWPSYVLLSPMTCHCWHFFVSQVFLSQRLELQKKWTLQIQLLLFTTFKIRTVTKYLITRRRLEYAWVQILEIRSCNSLHRRIFSGEKHVWLITDIPCSHWCGCTRPNTCQRFLCMNKVVLLDESVVYTNWPVKAFAGAVRTSLYKPFFCWC